MDPTLNEKHSICILPYGNNGETLANYALWILHFNSFKSHPFFLFLYNISLPRKINANQRHDL